MLDPGGNGADWTRADTVAYILAHQAEIAGESGRTGGNDTITGGAGNDVIYAQEGNDTINGAENDLLLDGGTGTDTLQVAAAFTSASDAQVNAIENVRLTAAAALNISQPD